MKRALRMLALTAAVTLASHSTAHATLKGTCRIWCGNGTHVVAMTSFADCCLQFDALCGSDGFATWTFGTEILQCSY